MQNIRRTLLGMAIGLITALLMVAAFKSFPIVSENSITVMGLGGSLGLLAAGVLTGASYALLFRPKPGNHLEHLLNGMILGLIIWVILSVNISPALMGMNPMWEITTIRHFFPAVIAFIFQGGFIGLIYGFLYLQQLEAWDLIEADVSSAAPPIKTRVVIIGGGYAGVNIAKSLERALQNEPEVGIWLVSDTNYLLHTPMLSEVTASAVDAQHISPVLRGFFHRVQVTQGRVARVDLEEKVIHWANDTLTPNQTLSFDHLIFAIGRRPDFYGNNKIEAEAFTFKSLEDAVVLRNQVIKMFEQADLEQDTQRRAKLLTFVVVGGGFAGVELIGALNDFARGMLPYYPNIPVQDLLLILVHSHEKILEELSEGLGKYAQMKLEQRGVKFILGERVTGAEPGCVFLGDRVLPTETLVWTGGNGPQPLLENLDLPLSEHGQIETDATLSVLDSSTLWAAGDCAKIPDLASGGFCPPTAQHALREGKTLGQNVAASIKGKPLKTFQYKGRGKLAALGYQVAVAEILGYRFSGFLAWLIWRALYLSKLPTVDRQVRVGMDWFLDIFFPPTMAQTISLSRGKARKHSAKNNQVR